GEGGGEPVAGGARGAAHAGGQDDLAALGIAGGIGQLGRVHPSDDALDVDAESAILAVDPKYARRLTTMRHQAYGPNVGVPRILRMLERNGVTGSFFVPGLTADRYPGAVEAIVAAGHDLGHHGYSHVPYHDLSDDEQRADVERALQSLERITGRRPEGFRAPWWELTDSTPALLAEYGFRWDSSMMDDDR